jgi:hypothetical protein
VKSEAQPINEEKLNAFIGKVVGDFGAALSSALVYIGLKLGLYKAMAGAPPVTPAELAQRTGTVERYVREWLINQGAATRACQTLTADGSLLMVEPMAGNTVEENLNPVGRTLSAASTLCCTANSLALGGPGFGAVASEQTLRETVLAGGFKHFRRATETPFNRVFEARR